MKFKHKVAEYREVEVEANLPAYSCERFDESAHYGRLSQRASGQFLFDQITTNDDGTVEIRFDTFYSFPERRADEYLGLGRYSSSKDEWARAVEEADSAVYRLKAGSK